MQIPEIFHHKSLEVMDLLWNKIADIESYQIFSLKQKVGGGYYYHELGKITDNGFDVYARIHTIPSETKIFLGPVFLLNDFTKIILDYFIKKDVLYATYDDVNPLWNFLETRYDILVDIPGLKIKDVVLHKGNYRQDFDLVIPFRRNISVILKDIS